MRRLAFVTVLLLAACAPAAPAGHTITGTMTLDAEGVDPGDTNTPGCRSKGGYEDIAEGAQVVVKDGAGSVLATTALGGGTQTVTDPGADCVFEFSVAVPDAEFYSIEVTHRGALTYSRVELEERGWTVSFSLG